MHQSSINIKPIKEKTSEAHNTRKYGMAHVHKSLLWKNEIWIDSLVSEKLEMQEKFCKSKSGRKMQSNAIPNKEAVVNLKHDHTLSDLHKLRKAFWDKFKIEIYQIYIHRDEGRIITDPEELKKLQKEPGAIVEDSEGNYIKINHHAHLVMSMQNPDTGKMLSFNKHHFGQMQTIVAEVLGMDRGVEGSKAHRLEAQAYKAKMDLKRSTKKLMDTEKHREYLDEEVKKKEFYDELCLNSEEIAGLEKREEKLKIERLGMKAAEMVMEMELNEIAQSTNQSSNKLTELKHNLELSEIELKDCNNIFQAVSTRRKVKKKELEESELTLKQLEKMRKEQEERLRELNAAMGTENIEKTEMRLEKLREKLKQARSSKARYDEAVRLSKIESPEIPDVAITTGASPQEEEKKRQEQEEEKKQEDLQFKL